ncbi:response regulator transcription factor [Nocardioides hankookensis]|uniref:LuxR C-terminal-related transcriptional regulator n=1 Tax=Nocardioides hankookensis TaxID=443157 RepID=A0ABW1LPT1_9ACTN
MGGSGPIRIAVVNDYELVVLGVASALAPYGDRIEVVELDSQLPLLSSVDILLYDTFGQAQGDAIDLDALGASSSRRVVIFSWNTDPHLVERALDAGADGYVSKAIGADELVTLLERVHRGEVVLPPASAELPDDEFGRWPGDREGLSARESEILSLITQGLSNDQIAERAFITKNTIKSHVRSIYRKIGVERRAQAVVWGVQHGMAPHARRTVGEDVQARARDVLDPG